MRFHERGGFEETGLRLKKTGREVAALLQQPLRATTEDRCISLKLSLFLNRCRTTAVRDGRGDKGRCQRACSTLGRAVGASGPSAVKKRRVSGANPSPREPSDCSDRRQFKGPFRRFSHYRWDHQDRQTA